MNWWMYSDFISLVDMFMKLCSLKSLPDISTLRFCLEMWRIDYSFLLKAFIDCQLVPALGNTNVTKLPW